MARTEGGFVGVLTFLRRSDGDGLCCELLVKVARVRLRADLGLEGRDQLEEGGAKRIKEQFHRSDV